MGFVSQVHENKAAAVEAGLKMANLLATKSPVAVQGTKELLNHARDHTVDESRFILSMPHPVDDLAGLRSAKDPPFHCYHRFALHGCMELRHAAIQRCLRGATVGYPEEEADIREAIVGDSFIASYSRTFHGLL